ncbi:MAG: hypothetical protein R3260_17440 [Pseudomonas sp.]|nr:hypothetical protein [Pseudomonas sp.]
MAALDYLHRAGLAVKIHGEHLRLGPSERITDNVRQFVRQHRDALFAEVSAQRYPPTTDVIRWLSSVARYLECTPGYLLVQGFIDRYDLSEQHRSHPRQVAALIRTHPAWIATSNAGRETLDNSSIDLGCHR